jgi:DNA gyrase subunit B
MESVNGGVAYDARAIVVLSDLEAVRRNPAMYVGSTGAGGLHQLVFELVDNAVDEAVAGYCHHISVVVHADGSCAVTDDGRGIPVDRHPDVGLPACEVLLTTLHSGGKFRVGAYGTSAGLHGVGMSCVNALSQWLRIDVWRDGAHHRQRFERGVPVTALERIGGSDRRGTQVWFTPDPTILEDCELSADAIVSRLEELAFLQSSLRISFRDERTGEEKEFTAGSGPAGFLDSRSDTATAIHPDPVVVVGQAGSVSFEAALRWTEGYSEQIWSFVNTVRTPNGGSHVDGLRAGLAAAIEGYAAAHGLPDRMPDERITTNDVLEGLTAVVAVRMSDPKFDGQTKRHLESPEVTPVVQEAVAAELTRCLAADPEMARRIVQRALDATRARLAARLASRAVRFERARIEVDYEVYRRQFGIRSKNWHESCSWLADEGLLRQHAALADVPPDARMLDVCCGSGIVGAAFDGKVGEKVGLDITPEMVRLASERLDVVHQGTVYDMPFEDSSFDLVVNREVLHLLPRPEEPLAEIFRVLRPGGQFIVGQIVPYADEDAFWMFRIFKKKQPLLFQMFREADFRQLILDAGFVDLQMTEYFLWESIDLWIDTHETTPAARQQIYRLFYDAPPEVRAVHPFEVGADGSVRDRWRWCVYSVRKPRD